MRPDLLRTLAVALAALLGVGVGLAIHEATADAGTADDEPDGTVEAAIVGGRPASLNPGTVRLEIANRDGQGWLCTGSLISPTAVLTAAHCVTPAGSIQAIVGQVGSFVVDDPAMASVIADRFDVHPTARGLLGGADVAVVHFAQPLPLEPVSLWGPGRLPAGLGSTEIAAETYGWGAVDPGGDIDADRLMAAATTILPDAGCDAAWGVRYVPGDMLCTGGATPCFGDSGGPLLVDLGEGRLSVGGVVSYGSAQCGLAPTVYTSVASVLDWLRQIVPDLTVSTATPVAPAPVPTVSAGYWVLERSGTVHEFGAPDLDPGVLPAGAVAIEPVSDGNGAWLLTPDGDVVALGSAPDLGSVRGWLGADERAAALAGTPSGAGYWIVTDRGRVVPFGDAPPLGDILGVQLNAGV
ncbi:MAG: serine protease, partial [Actinomycetota bacterium]